MSSPERAVAPFSYDPTVAIITEARHDNIAALPNTDEQVLRWYPPNNSWEMFTSADEALNFIRQRRLHLGMLNSLGRIAIPISEHSDVVGLDPEFHCNIVIYSTVDHLLDLRPLTARTDIRHVHSTLLKYFTWATSTQEPAFVLDFFKLDQFHHNPYAAAGEPAITMVDIDPYFVPTSETNQARAREALRKIKLRADVTTA